MNINIIKLYFKEHYLALIFAGMVGLISVAPELLAINYLGADYKGIPFFGIGDNLYYTAKLQELNDGHFWISSPFFYEYKNEKSLILPIGELFYFLPQKLFVLSVSRIILINKFLLPAILFFLVYSLAHKLTGRKNFSNRINSIATGLFVVLGYHLIDFKNAWSLIAGQTQYLSLLLWTRPVNPITGAVLIFIFLLIIWKIINKKPFYLSIIAGIILGLMVSYFFSWGISLSFVAVLMLIFLVKKEYKIFANLLTVVLVSFLAVLPYWLNLLQLLTSDKGGELSMRNAMFYTHEPMPNKVLLACLLLFLPCLIYESYQKRKVQEKLEIWWWFCLALLLGGLLALNQQIITGRTIWPYHFVQYSIPFAIVVTMVLFYNYIKPKFFSVWLAVVSLVILVSLLYGFASARSYIYSVNGMGQMQQYAAVFDWLNKNTPLDSVVLTKESEQNLSTLIPALTHCNVYVSSWIPLSLIPEDRVYHNYLSWLRINGVDPITVETYLYDHQAEVRGFFYTDIKMIFDEKENNYIENKIKQLSLDYQEFVKKDYRSELKRYRLDYILSVGPLSPGIIKQLTGIKPIFEANNLFVYSF